MIPILLAAVVSLPPEATVVRDWWWSESCAPQRATSTVCVPAETRHVHVTFEGKPAPGARVIWGTDAMRADLPDAELPFAITDDKGDAVLHVAKDPSVLMRVSGPRVATFWSAATAVAAFESHEATLEVFPAANATIELEQPTMSRSNDAPRSWAVAANGKITIPALPQVPYLIVVTADAGTPFVTTAIPAQLPPRIELVRGVIVAGRVVDPKRRPLESAAIETVFKIDGLPRGLRRRMQTTADGRFHTTVPAGAVQVIVRKTGRATALRHLQTNDDVDLGDITLLPSRDVAIRIVDIDGNAISDATLRTDGGVSAISGRDGIARLSNVPDSFTLTVKARGFRTFSGDAAEVIALERGVRVIGTVANAEKGNVLVLNNGARRVVAFENGAIDVAGLDAGTLALEVRAHGRAPIVFDERPVAENETWDLGALEVAEGATIRGRVVDGDAPLAGAVVRALRPRENGPAIAFVMRDWIEAVADENGGFVISGLTSASHVLIVEAPGFAPRVVAANIDKELTIELDRARRVDIDCTPAQRCGDEARLLYGGAEYPWASSSALLRDGRAQIGIAAPGNALLRLVRNGQVVHERSITISKDDATNVAIRLGATRVRGVVTSAGQPHRGGIVELHRDLREPDGMPIYLESRTPEGQVAEGRWLSAPARVETAVVDDAGRFAFEEIEPGEFRVAYRGELGATQPRRVVIPDAADFQLTFDLPPGELQGRIALEDGTPAAFATVRIVDASRSESVAATDRLGRFHVPGLAAGRATITAASGPLQASHAIDVDGRGPSTVDLVLTSMR